jgi:hypothetical protein
MLMPIPTGTAMAIKTKSTTERHVLSALPEEMRQAIVEEAVQWGLTVWKTRAIDLRNLWSDPKARETVIHLRRDETGALAGVASMKFIDVNYEGKDIVVVRLVLGANPGQRGDKFATRCLMVELLRWKALHPLTPLFLFSTLIHPVTYKLCCDLLKTQFYPYFKNTDNPPMERMIQYLAKQFGVERGDSPHPFVWREKFIAIETDQAMTYWRNNERPEVRFYVEHCPKYYNSADCLIGIASLSLPNVVFQMVRSLARNRLDKLLGRKIAFADRARSLPLATAMSGQHDDARL